MSELHGGPVVSGGTQPVPAAVADSPSTGVHEDDDARRELLQLSIAAAGVGTFDWDLVGGALEWDERLIELFGYDTATFDRTIEGFTDRLHPEDRPWVTAALQAAIDDRGQFVSRYRVLLPGDQVRWVSARGHVLSDENGTAARMVGAAWDDTATAESDARVTRVLESMSTAFFSVDHSWRFTYVNAEAERMLGRRREALLGGVLWQLFPAAVGSHFEEQYRRAMATGEPVTFDAYYPAPLDSWYEVRAWRNPDGLAVYFLDVTARRQVQEQSDRTVRRIDLVGRITEDLIDTLEPDEAVTRLARLVVPALADWCVVALIDDTAQSPTRRELRSAASWHTEPHLRDLTERYARARLDAMTSSSMVARAMTTGEPQFVATDALRTLAPTLVPGPAKDMLTTLDPYSVVIHRLNGRNGPVGMLTLCKGRSSGTFDVEALATARQVADRVGLVLDNARLHRRQRQVAEGLQRSLLTPPAQPDHVQVVVRYTPAAEVAQVGGDWHDAFLQPGGTLVLVIGDVVGHDTVAAAAMGQVRTLVRGVAVTTGAGPAEILDRVDHAMETLQVGSTATAVVARLEQTDAERSQGRTRLRWANAGHPPPMVVAPDGVVTVLSAAQPDLLLGVAPDTTRHEQEVTLEVGSIVLMCTDGLVERRGQSLEVGLDRLCAALRDLGPRDLDELCDALLERLLPAEAEDDVALLAIRLHPQDELRPRRAGPNRIPADVEPAPAVVPREHRRPGRS